MRNLPNHRGICYFLFMSICMFMFSLNIHASVQQQAKIQIKGTVVDKTGEPIIGASVLEKGTTNGTITNVDGEFTLKVTPKATISVSFVGYKSSSFTVGSSLTYKVTLEDDSELLNEVVVVGYGSMRKKDLTGAVAQVKADAFKNQPILNTSSALQGRVAGVSISNTSGAPGGQVKIRIRGANSVNNDNSPLIVLDGIPMGSLGLQDINPYDIASIDVLKDASATAVYGARGANGVIIISTKKGRTGTVSVDFKSNFSLNSPIRKYDLMNGSQYADYANQLSKKMPDAALPYPAGFSNANTNWQDKMFNDNRLTQNYQLSVTGGAKASRYYVSLFYQDQPGTLVNSKMSRGGLRTNLDFNITDKLSIGVNTYLERSYAKNNSDIGYKGNPVMAGLTWNPTAPVYVDGDESKGYLRYALLSPIAPNPYMSLMEADGENYKTSGFVNLKATYHFTDNLKFETSVSVDGYYNRGGSHNTKWVNPTNLTASQAFNESMTVQNSNILTYELKKGKHDLNLVGVYELWRNTTRGFNANGSGFPTMTFGYENLGLATTAGIGSDYAQASLMSYMARATYGYADRYMLTATVRRDGSSKFQEGNRWGTFPSFSFGWNVTNERFMKNQHIFDLLKLRAGWGATGSQNIAPYSTLALLSSGLYSFGTANGRKVYFAKNPSNPNLKWETTYQTNIGLDFAFLDNNLTFSLDFYKKTTKDLLLHSKIENYDGGGSLLTNIGEVENSGLEAVLGYTLASKAGFTWNTSLNMAYNKNKVVDLGKDEQIFRPRKDNNLIGTEIQIIKKGEPLGTFYLIPWEGIYQQDDAVLGFQKGDNKYRDVNGDHKIDFSDRTLCGTATPKVTMGFDNTFSYKGFDLNILLQGAYGHKIFNATYMATAMPTSDIAFPTSKDILDYWTPENTGAKWANPSSATNKNMAPSTQFLQSASYTRLKNISLAYTLPKNLTKNYGVKLFVSGQNLFTITNYKGFDPENSSTPSSSDADAGLDMGAYPSSKAVTFGINITFNK